MFIEQVDEFSGAHRSNNNTRRNSVIFCENIIFILCISDRNVLKNKYYAKETGIKLDVCVYFI